jgi:methyl-accepting chemotaxis protein
VYSRTPHKEKRIVFTFVVAVICSLIAGAAGRWAGARRSSGASAPSSASAGAGITAYLDSVEAFGTNVTPVWSGHVESSRRQMEDAVGALTTKFASIVMLLDEALASSRSAIGGGHSQLFDSSRLRLAEVVEALDTTLAQKQQSLESLSVLVDLNEQMKSMTAQVTRIASQTHLLALNAAIEAQRVGEVGQAFGVVALEVRQLADLSGTTGQRIGQMADQVTDAINSAFSLATSNAEHEETLVADAGQKVHAVLDDLLGFVSSLQDSADGLGHAAEGIKDEIAGSLVEFQFQDRIGQTLQHVRDSIDEFPQVAARARVHGPGQLQPLDHEGVLQRLKESYTMAEEHQVGGTTAPGVTSIPAQARESEITFF